MRHASTLLYRPDSLTHVACLPPIWTCFECARERFRNHEGERKRRSLSLHYSWCGPSAAKRESAHALVSAPNESGATSGGACDRSRIGRIVYVCLHVCPLRVSVDDDDDDVSSLPHAARLKEAFAPRRFTWSWKMKLRRSRGVVLLLLLLFGAESVVGNSCEFFWYVVWNLKKNCIQFAKKWIKCGKIKEKCIFGKVMLQVMCKLSVY